MSDARVETRPRAESVARDEQDTDVELPPPVHVLRRIGKRPALSHHNRLIFLVIATNLGLLVNALGPGDWWSTPGNTALSELSNVTLANFALAILIRQQYVINALFWLATRAPVTWPLRVRWTLGKVYHFGGLHVGGAIAGTLWFLAYTGTLIDSWVRNESGAGTGRLAVSCALTLVLLGVVTTALQPLRSRFHDVFERTHRFGGWTALALFWAQTVMASGGRTPATEPAIWVLGVVTLSVALPWMRLRKVTVAIDRPSPHVALTRFDHGVTPFPGSSTAVSRNPLREWHSFANVPAPGRAGFRLTISRAGDWTASFIDDAPARVWVKGIPTAGVANIETLFTKVVYVATGSGIGPVLPHLLADDVPSKLVWATRSPRETYGDELVDEILATRPDALVWDTSVLGKPDMLRLTYAAYVSSAAEAVICISNKKLTWSVVHGMERLGIPAYGAIWDS
ncbi:MAG TPA: hypothetical protein VFU65_19355 [Actinocrinis sp.]|nr:hypothetical protein [Actinocrinis sp.]